MAATGFTRRLKVKARFFGEPFLSASDPPSGGAV